MGSRLIATRVAVAAAVMMCGCQSLLDPSDQVRHASYLKYQNLFAGNNDAARRQTYIIFSGGPQFRATMDPDSGQINWFAGTKGFSIGLAVGFASDGYLVTAAHALNTNNLVLGWFDGRMDLKPARVVFQRGPNTHADVALIKAEGKVVDCGLVGEMPTAGDRVFAVVCCRHDTQLAVDFAAGTVLGVARDPLGGSLNLIKTDIPLRRGDSGGPLLSSAGRLVGINSGISFTWRQHWSDAFFADRTFIQRLVEDDRVRGAPKPQAGVKGRQQLRSAWIQTSTSTVSGRPPGALGGRQ